MPFSHDVDEEDGWSGDETFTEVESIPPSLLPRAYQIEMFQQSMKQNTIVTVRSRSKLPRFMLKAEIDGNRQRQDDDVRST